MASGFTASEKQEIYDTFTTNKEPDTKRGRHLQCNALIF